MPNGARLDGRRTVSALDVESMEAAATPFEQAKAEIVSQECLQLNRAFPHLTRSGRHDMDLAIAFKSAGS